MQGRLCRWGERAIAAGVLTIGDIRNGDPVACTLLARAVSAMPETEAHPHHPPAVVSCRKHADERQRALERLMALLLAIADRRSLI